MFRRYLCISGEVWGLVTAAAVIWGATLWIFEVILRRIFLSYIVQVSMAALHSWGALLKQCIAYTAVPPSRKVGGPSLSLSLSLMMRVTYVFFSCELS